MILEFVGNPVTLLRVNNATPNEMALIEQVCSAKVEKFQIKRGSNWDGTIKFVYFLEGYYYVPAGCWRRLIALREPDEQAYRFAYDVQFIGSEKYFNKELTIEAVSDFVETLNLPYEDLFDQITVLHAILFYARSAHHIATGFGKTCLSYMAAKYTQVILEGKTLLICPRTALITQGVSDFTEFQSHIEPDDRLKLYSVFSNAINTCKAEEADVIIGTFQSLVNYPVDFFDDITTVIIDEGHTAGAISIRDVVSKCRNSKVSTSISGTQGYVSPAVDLTIESFCGPLILSYPVHEQIKKGRLPEVAVQPILIKHTTNYEGYLALLQANRLPNVKTIDPELSATYRRMEITWLTTNMVFMNWMLDLAEQYTSRNMNFLIIFKNKQPIFNLFDLAKERGLKCHMIHGRTPNNIRTEIKAQIEAETGWILAATDGTMSMGVSINNLHSGASALIGKSPHVTLQAIGRMLRKHPNKLQKTIWYDISNDISSFGTSYTLHNAEERMHYYTLEKYEILPKIHRIL